MAVVPASPHAASAVELKAQIEAEREGYPFLIYRDDDGRHELLVLEPDRERITLGRRSSADVTLFWDDEVSRLHAEIVRRGEDWTVEDNGLSLNGTFVNAEPVHGHRRLNDGDALRLGSTVIVFRNPGDRESRVTTPSADLRKVVELTDSQRRVLVALCRPFKDSAAFVTPPPNEQIANELFLSVDAVKKHMRALFEKFEVQHLPQNEKRARLVERAFAGGFISERHL
jgi:pSer/pThr/pTyr-binding forkhead associated (FHA) protein